MAFRSPSIQSADSGRYQGPEWKQTTEKEFRSIRLTEDELQANDTRKYGKAFAKLSDTEELRRWRLENSPLARIQADAWTTYMRRYVTMRQNRGDCYTAREHLATHQIELKEGEPRTVTEQCFSAKLKLFLKLHHAKSVMECRMPTVRIPLLEFADQRLANGPIFTMTDTPTLVCLHFWFHNPRSSVRTIYEQVKTHMESKDFKLKPFVDVPSYKQVLYLLRNLPNHIKVLVVEGSKKFWVKYGPAQPINYGPMNTVWSGDGFYYKKYHTRSPVLWFRDPKKKENKGLVSLSISYTMENHFRYPIEILVEVRDAPNQFTGLQLLRMSMAEPEDPDDDRLIHGRPEFFISDGRTPFDGEVVDIAFKGAEIEHEQIDSGCSSQNGRCERKVQTLKEISCAPLYRELGEGTKRNPLPIELLPRAIEIIISSFRSARHQKHRDLNDRTPHECVAEWIKKHPITPIPVEDIILMTSYRQEVPLTRNGIKIEVPIPGEESATEKVKLTYFNKALIEENPDTMVEAYFDPLNPKGDIPVYIGDEFLGTMSLVGDGISFRTHIRNGRNKRLQNPVKKHVQAIKDIAKEVVEPSPRNDAEPKTKSSKNTPDTTGSATTIEQLPEI